MENLIYDRADTDPFIQKNIQENIAAFNADAETLPKGAEALVPAAEEEAGTGRIDAV